MENTMYENIKEIVKKDFHILIHSPAVLVVILVIMLIPAMYATLTIESTWDPYANTGNIKVAVVNNDVGYTLDNGSYYNIGNMLVNELHHNNNFSWVFVNESNAKYGVHEGTYTAALVIPKNFSEQLMTVDSNNPERAQIDYYVNEKLNAINPVILRSGTSILEAKINDQVVTAVDSIIFGKLKDAAGILDKNKGDLYKAQSFANDLNSNTGKVDQGLSEANSDMSTIKNIWPQIYNALPEVKGYLGTLQSDYDVLNDQINNHDSKSRTTITKMKAEANASYSDLYTFDVYLRSMYNMTHYQPLLPILNKVETNMVKLQQVMNALNEVEATMDSPEVHNKLATTGSLLQTSNKYVDELYNDRDDISTKINNASYALSVANNDWPKVKATIPIIAAKLNSISPDTVEKLAAYKDMNLSGVKNYFENPVQLKKHKMFSVPNYGSGLAPFYNSISLWIGCLVAIAMIKRQVKYSDKYSPLEVFFGRLPFFLLIAFVQATGVIVCDFLMKIQITNPITWIFSLYFIALCFMIIAYCFYSALGNAGKLIVMVILLLQITASGGIFAVELMPPFFAHVNPYLPLTYSVGALREIIAGIIWNHYWWNISKLAIMPVGLFIITIVVKEKFDRKSQALERILDDSGFF